MVIIDNLRSLLKYRDFSPDTRRFTSGDVEV